MSVAHALRTMPAAADTTARLTALRALMRARGVDAYVVPSEDAHQSEYISPVDGRRAFISGFTGSAGLAVVMHDKAALWTDGRYYLQASHELDTNWVLMKSGMTGTPTKEQWIASNSQPGSNVAFDPCLCSVREFRIMGANLSSHKLTPLGENLIDRVWNDHGGRPEYPPASYVVHDETYAGCSVAKKLSVVRQGITELIESDFSDLLRSNPGVPPNAKPKDINIHGLLLSSLDDIAWLFNLRASNDIPYNPVFFAYAYVPADPNAKPSLYVRDPAKLAELVSAAASAASLPYTILPYTDVFKDMLALSRQLAESNLRVMIDLRCNMALHESLGSSKTFVVKCNPVTLSKAIKNPREQQGFRDCHVRDGAALALFFGRLEHKLMKEGAKVDEVDAADMLEECRRTIAGKMFFSLSFNTISASGPNGSVIHYAPHRGSKEIRAVNAMEPYLCDSGAQYLDGTTDVTRTLMFGDAKLPEVTRMYTRVLQGHIALATARFPPLTTGLQLDTLARAPLWRDMREFRHGVGHGVGYFLNVHEGPQVLAARPQAALQSFVPGMTITNEPGYYEDGKYGIRIENILLVRKITEQFYEFENVTLAPYERKLIERSLLSNDEIDFINSYHKEVYEKVSPLLKDYPVGLEWLTRNTSPI